MKWALFLGRGRSQYGPCNKIRIEKAPSRIDNWSEPCMRSLNLCDKLMKCRKEHFSPYSQVPSNLYLTQSFRSVDSLRAIADPRSDLCRMLWERQVAYGGGARLVYEFGPSPKYAELVFVRKFTCVTKPGWSCFVRKCPKFLRSIIQIHQKQNLN